jgi:hypothetical protein
MGAGIRCESRSSLLGGLNFPITTAALGLAWSYARLDWAKGYADEPGKRYQGTGMLVWYAWLGLVTTAGATAVLMLRDATK